jgi:hypothetical protein
MRRAGLPREQEVVARQHMTIQTKAQFHR